MYIIDQIRLKPFETETEISSRYLMTTNIALKHKYKRNKCLGHFSTQMLSTRLLQLYTLSSIDHRNTIHVN